MRARVVLGLVASCLGCADGGSTGDPVPLKEAKLLIEHNATDLDSGFQGFIDSEGWESLTVTGPDGPVLSFQALAGLDGLGLTELFFETVEPENADVPLDELLAKLPEGEYVIAGPDVEGGTTSGTAVLSHDIPAGPVLVAPAEGASVPPSNLVMAWDPVTETLDGASVTIVAYELIVERDEEPHPRAFAKRHMSIHVPPEVTSVTVPNEFLEAATPYLWEVLAIADNGNQTLSSGTFSTQ